MKIYAMYRHDRPLPDDLVSIRYDEFDQLLREKEFYRDSLVDVIQHAQALSDRITAVYSYCYKNNIPFPEPHPGLPFEPSTADCGSDNF